MVSVRVGVHFSRHSSGDAVVCSHAGQSEWGLGAARSAWGKVAIRVVVLRDDFDLLVEDFPQFDRFVWGQQRVEKDEPGGTGRERLCARTRGDDDTSTLNANLEG